MFRIFLILMLLVHSVVTVVTLWESGPLSPFPPFDQDFVYQIFSDLATALGILLLIIYFQLKKKKRPLRGWVLTVVGTILIGSFAPLLFLILEKDLFEDFP